MLDIVVKQRIAPGTEPQAGDRTPALTQRSRIRLASGAYTEN
jgi:hypothetical protein